MKVQYENDDDDDDDDDELEKGADSPMTIVPFVGLFFAYLVCFLFLNYPNSEFITIFVLLILHILLVVCVLKIDKPSMTIQLFPVHQNLIESLEEVNVDFNGCFDVKTFFFLCAGLLIATNIIVAMVFVRKHTLSLKDVPANTNPFHKQSTQVKCKTLKILMFYDTFFLMFLVGLMLNTDSRTNLTRYMESHDIFNIFLMIFFFGVTVSCLSVYYAQEAGVSTGTYSNFSFL